MKRESPHRDAGFGRPVWLSLLAASGWILYTCARMWWQPILADEWDFFRAMENWQANRALIPHPQAYVHLGQLSMALFGANAGAARIVGVGCTLLSLWLIPLLVNVFWRDHPQRQRIGILSIAFTALSPMTLQNAMLVDIDNTLLIPAIMLLVCVWGEAQMRSARTRVIWLALVLAGTLWVKLPTPPLIMAALWLYHVARRQWQRAIELIVASLCALVLFALTFALYSRLTGFEWAYFGPTFGRVAVFFNAAELLARFPQGVGVFVMWLSLPLTLLALLALVKSLQRILRGQMIVSDALSPCVIVVTLFYTIFYLPAWGYPRYLSPIAPLLMALVAAIVAPYMVKLSRPAQLYLALLGVGLLALNLWLWPDPLYPLYSVTFEGDLFDLRRRLFSGLSIMAVLSLPIAGVLGIAWLIARARSLLVRPVAASLLVVLSIASLLSIDLTQIGAGYSTRYRYTYDYADYYWSVRTARASGRTAFILAIKDALYESQLAGEEIYPYLCATCAGRLLDAVHTRMIDAIIWTTKEEARSPAVAGDASVRAELAVCYDRQTRGEFILYLLKPNHTCR